jgi:signal peptidase II
MSEQSPESCEKRILLALLIMISTVACDQVSKGVAERTLRHQGIIELAGGVAKLLYVENSGAFLGLGSDLPDALRVFLFIGLAAFAVLAGLWLLWRNQARLSRRATVGIALFLGGALGNLLDRVLRDGGRVVDFMQLGIGPLRTGVFNVADVVLMAAVPLLVWRSRRRANPP